MKKQRLFLGICLILFSGCTKDIQPDKPIIQSFNKVYIPVPASLKYSGSKSSMTKSKILGDSIVVDTLIIADLPSTFSLDSMMAFFTFDDSTVNRGTADNGVVSNGYFNGTDDKTYIKVPNDNGLMNFNNKNFSIGVWVFPVQHIDSVNGNPMYQTMVSKCSPLRPGSGAEAFSILIGEDVTFIEGQNHKTGVCFAINDGNSQISTVFNMNSGELINKWHFVTAVCSITDNNYSLTLYVDGVKGDVATNYLSDWNDSNNLNFYIGTDLFGSGNIPMNDNRYFYGALDNVMVFNYALSANEVSELFKLGEVIK